MQRYKFGGKELDQMHGLNWYDFHARPYDPVLNRFVTMDPLAEKYYSISPYAYCFNNPMKYIDPDGKKPIYNPDGYLLGTDEYGLQGYAIVMNQENFSQGMSNEDAMSYNLGKKGFKDNDAKSRFSKNFNELKYRPDYDGELTLSEANYWYRNGKGSPLYIDAKQIDLSGADATMLTVGEEKGHNFLLLKGSNLSTVLVYGTLALTLLDDKGNVHIGPNAKPGVLDTYDFEQQGGQTIRNVLTKIGVVVAGDGQGYDIRGYGIGKVQMNPSRIDPWIGPKR